MADEQVNQVTPEVAVLMLRAKASELEAHAETEMEKLQPDTANVAADIALIAGLLADHIERTGIDVTPATPLSIDP